jgi:hypothetical protein
MSCAPATTADLDHRTDDIAGKGVAVDVGQRDLAADPGASSGDNRWSTSDSVMTVTCNSDRQILTHGF